MANKKSSNIQDKLYRVGKFTFPSIRTLAYYLQVKPSYIRNYISTKTDGLDSISVFMIGSSKVLIDRLSVAEDN